MDEQERPTSKLRVPAGIDYLLSLGARDPKFRERLLKDPLAAARRAGLRLTDSERAILSALPDEQLRAVIDNATPPRTARRSFLQRAALWMAGLFGGVTMTTMAGCAAPTPKGAAPDVPPPRRESPDQDAAERAPGPVTGARSDMPLPKGD